MSRWHNYFLLTGVLLSARAGRDRVPVRAAARSTSGAMGVTNRRLDAQIRELNERDTKLRRLNDELSSCA